MIDPASHHALMRDGLKLVAGRYLVWIACMMMLSMLVDDAGLHPIAPSTDATG